MNAFAQLAVTPLLWCFLQVTLFAAIALWVYAFARRQGANRNVMLLSVSLSIVGTLTLLSASPWPNWNGALSSSQDWRLPQSRLPGISHFVERIASPSPTTNTNNSSHRVEPALLPDLAQNNLLLANTASSIRPPNWRAVAIGAAMLLIAFGIARFLIGLAYVHNCRRNSSPIDDSDLANEFQRIARQLSIPRPCELRESPTLEVAATLGWRRPIVLLPTTWREWSNDERCAVLSHELSHVALRHFPLWVVGQLAVAAHFYHPLVHWLGRRLRFEQELAADELAITAFGSRRRYVEILAGLALGSNRRPAAYASLGLFMSRPLLMRRIAMLRQPAREVTRSQRTLGSAAALLLVATALAVVGIRSTPLVAADDAPIQSTPEPGVGIETANSTTALLQVSGNQRPEILVRTQVALLKSYSVVTAALKQPEIAQLSVLENHPDRLLWVIDHLDVGYIPNSNIVYVRMKDAGDDIEQLRKLVNAVVQSSLNEWEKEYSENETQARQSRDALQRKFDTLNDEIRQKLQAANEVVASTGVSSRPSRKVDLLVQEVNNASKAKADLEVKLAEVQAAYMAAEEQLRDPTDLDKIVEIQLSDDPNIKMLNQELIQLQHELHLRSRETKSEQNAESQQLQQQIKIKRERIAAYEAEVKRQLHDSANIERDLDSQRKSMRKEFQIRAGVLQQQIAQLNKAIREKTDQLKFMSPDSLPQDLLGPDLERLQNTARDVNLEFERLDVESGLLPRVRIIQWAM